MIGETLIEVVREGQYLFDMGNDLNGCASRGCMDTEFLPSHPVYRIRMYDLARPAVDRGHPGCSRCVVGNSNR